MFSVKILVLINISVNFKNFFCVLNNEELSTLFIGEEPPFFSSLQDQWDACTCKVPDTKPETLISIPRIHTVKGEKQLPEVVFDFHTHQSTLTYLPHYHMVGLEINLEC